jgi:hypothetical protein
MPKIAIFENVIGFLKGDNAKCLTYLCNTVGYMVVIMDLNTINFFLPQFRPRVWIACYRKCFLMDAGVSESDATAFLLSMVDRLGSGNASLTLDDVLLPETDPAVCRYLRLCHDMPGPYSNGGASGRNGGASGGASWLDDHMGINGVDAWLDQETFILDELDFEIFPGFKHLTLRQCDLLQHKGIRKLPLVPARIVNVSQAMKRAQVAEEATHTVTPHSELFHTGRCRLRMSLA